MRTIFLLCLLYCESILSQNCNKQLQLAVDKKDTAYLWDSTCINAFLSNSGQSLLLLKLAVASRDTIKTIYIVDQISKFGIPAEKLLNLFDTTSIYFLKNVFYNKSDLLNKYNYYIDSLNNSIKYYTISLIEDLYTVDQAIRRSYRKNLPIETFSSTLRLIDSLNFMILFELIKKDSSGIFDVNIGYYNAEKLYLILLHSCREISEDKFLQLQVILHRLVLMNKINPYFYANIVDERARYLGKSEYPIYNYLRSIKNDHEEQIERNRFEIGAFKLKN